MKRNDTASGRGAITRREFAGILGAGATGIAAAYALAGCGSGSHTSGNNTDKTGNALGPKAGRITVALQWSADGRATGSTRFVPARADRALITVHAGNAIVAAQTLARPQSQAVFDGLPIEDLQFVVEVYDSAQSTHSAAPLVLANATIDRSGAARLKARQSETIAVTLASGVARIEVVPATLSLLVGAQQKLTATAKAKDGSVILLPPGDFAWKSSDARIAGVDANGLVTALVSGVVTIDALENGFGADAVSSSASQTGARTTTRVLNSIYIVETSSGALSRLNDANDKAPLSFGVIVDKNGSSPLGRPSVVCVDEQGRIYTASGQTIYRLDDASGSNLISLDGNATGLFGQVSGLATDKAGRLYIADGSGNQIARVDDMRGSNPVAFGTSGSGAGQFSGPAFVRLDSQERIYVADTKNNRVARMDDMSGRGFTTYAVPDVQQPGQTRGIALDRLDRLYILDRGFPTLPYDTGAPRLRRVDDLSGANPIEYRFGQYQIADSFGLNSVFVDQAGHIYFSTTGIVYYMDDLTGSNLHSLARAASIYARPPQIGDVFVR